MITGQSCVGGQMRRAFLSKRTGDFAVSAGFQPSRGYISCASRRAPTSMVNLPALFEFRQLTETEMRVADAIAPDNQARYFSDIWPQSVFTQ